MPHGRPHIWSLPPKQTAWAGGADAHLRPRWRPRCCDARWRSLVGMYVGRSKGKLRVRFSEFGGALLLCNPQELRYVAPPTVGKENFVAGVEPSVNDE